MSLKINIKLTVASPEKSSLYLYWIPRDGNILKFEINIQFPLGPLFLALEMDDELISFQ